MYGIILDKNDSRIDFLVHNLKFIDMVWVFYKCFGSVSIFIWIVLVFPSVERCFHISYLKSFWVKQNMNTSFIICTNNSIPNLRNRFSVLFETMICPGVFMLSASFIKYLLSEILTTSFLKLRQVRKLYTFFHELFLYAEFWSHQKHLFWVLFW